MSDAGVTDSSAPRDAAGQELSIRDRLVAAAAAVIDDVGEDQLTLAQVVRRAGLTTGAVYSNFANREELVIAVYIDEYAGRMWEGVSGLEAIVDSDLRGTDFAEALRLLIIRPDDPKFRTSRWLRIRAVAAAQRYPQVHASISDLQGQIAARLIALVERSQAAGDIDATLDPRSVALLLQQFGFALVLADLSGGHAPDPDQWVDFAHRLVLPLFGGRVHG